jgi:predicted DNA-binding antitoxin AbrB/MazE fold protein
LAYTDLIRGRSAPGDPNRRKTMGTTIRARFSKGIFEPLEPLDLPEGEVLTLTVIRLAAAEKGGGLERCAGGWKGLIDAEELKCHIYTDRLITTRPEPRL